MYKSVFAQAGEYLRDRNRHMRWLSLLLALSIIVGSGTVAILTLPGVAMTHQVKLLDCPYAGQSVAHTHNGDCYGADGALVCPLEEQPLHTHGESCYEIERTLVCAEEESELHMHTDECYAEERALVCGLEELTEEHVHGGECFITVEASEEQPSAAEAEETEYAAGFEYAEAYLPEPEPEYTLTLTGVWGVDLVVAARSQLGVSESADSVTAELGESGGYTVYGEAYGLPYDVWDAAFVSWCLDRAQIPEEYVPRGTDAAEWLELLARADLISDDSAYSPRAGDLVFLADDYAVRVGVVSEVTEEYFRAVEGDSLDAVCENVYYRYDLENADPDDPYAAAVRGWFAMPENPALEGLAYAQGEDAARMPAQTFMDRADGVVVVVEAGEGAFPAGTAMVVTPVYEEDTLDAAVSAVEGDVVRVQAVDIGFVDADGREIEPATEILVSMLPEDISAEEAPVVVHVDDEGAAEIVDQVEDIGNAAEVVFRADAFSVYALVFTVDFTYGGRGHSIAGESEILLSELFAALGIERELTGSAAVFSDASLISLRAVTDEDGTVTDWLLTSLCAFSTEEYLIVEFADGTGLTVIVTDDQVEIERTHITISMLDGAEPVGEDLVWRADTYQPGHAFSFRVSYSFSTNTVSKTQWEIGQIQITLPRSILLDREGEEADDFMLSLPADDDATLTDDNVFAYRVDGDNIVIYNRVPAAPTQVGYFEISYITGDPTYSYGDYGSGKHDASDPAMATLTIYDEKLVWDEEKEEYTAEVDPEEILQQRESEKIPVYIDTYARVTATDKREPVKNDSWRSDWGTEPETMARISDAAGDDPQYVYVTWAVRSEIEANQPFTFRLDDVFTPDYGEVIGYRMTGNPLYKTGDYKSSNYIPASVEGANYIEGLVLPQGYGVRTDYVLTRLEKEYYDRLILENGSYIVTNTVTATVKPEDGVDAPSSVTDSESFTDKAVTFIAPTVNFNSGKQGLTTSYRLTEFMEYAILSDGTPRENSISEIPGLEYSVTMNGNAYRYTYKFTGGEGESDPGPDTADGAQYYGKQPVTYRLEDKELWLVYTPAAEGSKSVTTQPLTKDDYRIDLLRFDYDFRKGVYDERSQSFSGAAISDAELMQFAEDGVLGELIFTIENNGEPVEGAEIRYSFTTEEFTVTEKAKPYFDDTYSSGTSKVLAFKRGEGVNITGFAITNDNALYSTRLTAYPAVALKRDIGGEGIVETALKDIKAADAPSLALWNRAEVSAAQAETKLYSRAVSDRDPIIGDTRVSDIEKHFTARRNDTINSRYLVTWEANMAETYTIDGVKYPVEQNGGTFYDLLPLGMELLPDTVLVYADGAALDSGRYSVEIESNYRDTGRVLVTVSIGKPADYYSLVYTSAMSWDAILQQRVGSTIVNTHNAISYVTGNEDIGAFGGDAYRYHKNNLHRDEAFTDVDDAGLGWLYADDDDDPDTRPDTEARVISTVYDCPVGALVSGTLGLSKTVRATDSSSGYGKSAVTYSNGEYAYHLSFGPNEGSKVKDLILYDFLEAYDRSELSSQWYGTFRSVDTSLAVAMGAAPVVYYSTLSREALLEKLMDADPANDPTSLTALIDGTSVWQKASEYHGALSDVTAVAVDLTQCPPDPLGNAEEFVLHGGETISVLVYLHAPNEAVTEEDEQGVEHVVPEAKTYNEVYLHQNLTDENDRFDNTRGETVHQGYTSVVYRVVGSLSISKVSSETVQPVEGVAFRLKGVSAYGTEIDRTVTSGVNGRIVFPNLELTGDVYGPYQLWEIGGNDDYLADDSMMYVTVEADGSVTVTDKDGFVITSESGGSVKAHGSDYQITNEPRIHGDLEFIKMGHQDGGEDKALSGALFRLSGLSDYGNTIVLYATSGLDGTVLFRNVEKGSGYTLEELLPADGYLRANRTFTVTCTADGICTMEMVGKADGANVEFTPVDYAHDVYTYTVTDEPEHTLGLMKVDALDGVGLRGAVFTLNGTSDYGTTVHRTSTSRMDATADFTGLEPGVYYLVETAAPSRTFGTGEEAYTVCYDLDPTIYTVVITKKGEVTVTYTDENGETQTLTNVVDGTVVTTDGDLTAEVEARPSERFFYTRMGRFNVPNDRALEGTLTIVKKWLDAEGDQLTDTAGFPIPEVHVDAEVPVAGIHPAKIDRTKWDAATAAGRKNITAILQWDKETPDSLEDWTPVSVENDDEFSGKIYVKYVGDTLYWLADTTELYFPEDCSNMFRGDSGYYEKLTDFDLDTAFSTRYTTTVAYMFWQTKLKEATMTKFDTSRIWNFAYMFGNAKPIDGNSYLNGVKNDSLTKIELSNPYRVTYVGAQPRNMSYMFSFNLAVETITLTNINTEHVTTMEGMFLMDWYKYFNPKLTAIIGLTELDTSSVTNMTLMFQGCNSMTEFDLSGFNTEKVRSTHSMFKRDNKLQTIYVGKGWKMGSVTDDTGMFDTCSALKGENGAKPGNIGKTNAHNGPGGYLTGKYDGDGSLVAPYTTPPGVEPPPSAGATSTPSELNMVTTSALNTDPGEGTIYDEWVYNEDGTWTYNFHVADVDTDYYVFETQPGEGLMSSWTWVEGKTADWLTLSYVHDGDNNSATVTNQKKDEPPPERKTGDLLVTKRMADGGDYSGDGFTFIVTIGGEDKTFTLKPGESELFSGLEEGTVYTVKEKLTADYEAPDPNEGAPAADGEYTVYTIAEGTITDGTQTRVTATNKPKPTSGDLTITKKAESAEGVTDLDPDAVYTVTAELWTETVIADGEGNETVARHAVTGTYGGAGGAVSFTETAVDNGTVGTAEISLKSGETFTLSGLPAGVRYTVTETAYERFDTAYTLNDGDADAAPVTDAVAGGETDAVVIRNTKAENDPVGGFLLRKVLGEGTTASEAFRFVAELSGLDDAKTYTYTVKDAEDAEAQSFTFQSRDGAAYVELSLRAGQTADFTADVCRLPVGATYRITEAASAYAAAYTLENSKDEEGSLIGSIAQTQGGSDKTENALSTQVETVDADERTAVTFTNTEQLQRLRIIKKESANELPLDGAELTLYKITVTANGDGTETMTEAPELVRAFTSSVAAEQIPARHGSYLLRESGTPAGYLTAKDIRIELTQSGELTYWSVAADETVPDGEGGETAVTTFRPDGSGVIGGNVDMLEIEMIDDPIRLTVQKRDTNGHTLKNAVLGVLPADGDEPLDFGPTDKDGFYVVSDTLTLDTDYILRELVPPSGYARAEDICFKFTQDAESGALILWQKNAQGAYEKVLDAAGEPLLTLTMIDASEFVFYKEWRDATGVIGLNWPEDKAITVTVLRTYSHGEGRTEDEAFSLVYEIPAGPTAGQTFNDSTESYPLTYTDSRIDSKGLLDHCFSIMGLPLYGTVELDGIETEVEYTYYVSEQAVEGWQSPKYYTNGNRINGAQRVGNGGVIANDMIGYELPAAGGFGIKGFTICGAGLICLGTIGLLVPGRKRRRGRGAGAM